MAKRRPTSSGSAPRGTADDAFTARVLQFVVWARDRTEVLIAMVVLAVLLVGGGIYYYNQRTAQLQQAEVELQVIQRTLAFVEPSEGLQQLREFVAQYSGTPHATEARLALAELLLEENRPQEAVDTLSEVAPSYRDPLRLQATILLAVALEEAEDWPRAIEVYGELAERAEFSHQRRDAAEGLARSHLAQGDTAAAAAAYQRALEELDEGDEERRNYFEMRLAELQGIDDA